MCAIIVVVQNISKGSVRVRVRYDHCHRGGVLAMVGVAVTGDGMLVGFGVDVPLAFERFVICCAL